MICCHADRVNLTTADKQFLNRTCQFITVFSICVVFFPLSHTEHSKDIAEAPLALPVADPEDLLKIIFESGQNNKQGFCKGGLLLPKKAFLKTIFQSQLGWLNGLSAGLGIQVSPV